MDSLLYGILGLSLATNLVTFIGTIATNAKRRDEENQRTLSTVRDELLNRIGEVDRRVDGEVSLLHNSINSEVNGLTSKIEEMDRTLISMIDNLEEEVYNSQDRFYEIAEAETACCKSKKRN